uniref:uncharacterized protein LOC122583698 n=1 Tax=Erigeron canadensis TaxID=72917 RepID=UPI001CB9153B|nr:uncharacterized protein LOC122583698 [Erigeron canadensis]
MLHSRDLIKQHVWYIIGDGKNVSMWYEKWCLEGPLSNFITKRMLYDARMDAGWEERFNILKNIKIPSLQMDKKDELMCVTRDNLQMKFNTKQAWQDLRNNWPRVEWNDPIWFKQFNPIHAFILWLAVQGRLMTLDRIDKWKQNGVVQCGLCKSGDETHEHLFFKYNFTEQIWRSLRSFSWNLRNVNSIQQMVQEIAKNKGHNNIGSVVNKLIIVAAVYYTWQERNNRIFKMKKRNEEAVCNIIKESVSVKLISLKIKNTENVSRIGEQWSLRWNDFCFVAV